MQPKNLSLKKIKLYTALLVVLILSFGGFISCNNKQEFKKGSGPSCMTLSYSQLMKSWEKKKYLSSIDYVTFVTCYNSITGRFEVSAQAFKKDYTKIGDLIRLKEDEKCTVTLPKFTVGENNIDFKDLDIVGADGKLKEFDKIILTPEVSGLPCNNLYFKESVETKGKIVPLGQTFPCPPCYNCRPIPSGCVVPDSLKKFPPTLVIDTVQNNK